MPTKSHFQICFGGSADILGHSRLEARFRLILVLRPVKLEIPNLSEYVPQMY